MCWGAMLTGGAEKGSGNDQSGIWEREYRSGIERALIRQCGALHIGGRLTGLLFDAELEYLLPH